MNKGSIKQILLPKTVLVTSTILVMLSLNACQTVPSTTTGSSVTTIVRQAPAVDSNDYEGEDDYIDQDLDGDSAEDLDEDDFPIEPYIPPEPSATPDPIIEQTPIFAPPSMIVTTPSSEDYITMPTPVRPPTLPPAQPTSPSHNELLERARQNSKQQPRQATANNSKLPAFQNLMQSGINQLKAGNLTAAESSFTRAQRLAPKSSAVYFYSAQVALKKNQPRKAEAMARRGLNVSKDNSRRRALWQIILRSGQLQNNPRVIREAQQALR
ncbi:hypothetical protein RCH20_001251 [Psychrobacter sp. PL15]|uniref:tetratricopeptide repeat protein n=1 Tax=unclassified Psychrobacter TaxID=196806 RepID=UPI002DFA8E98|nr:hypothetical protein [Psychrobacter sp. PL15]